MFSEEDLGLNPIVDPTTGEYFIDRDGRWFHLILEHLRDQQPDVLALRLSLQDRAALYREAQFFGLNGLTGPLELAQQQQLFFDLLQERERRAKDVVAAQVKGERSAAEFLKAVQQITAALVRTCPHRPLPRCQWQVPYQPLTSYPDPYVVLHHLCDLLLSTGFDITVLGGYGLRGSVVVAELRITDVEMFNIHKFILASQ
eukprot:EG_transcript_29754